MYNCQLIEVGGYFDLGNGVKAKSPGESGTPENDCNCRCYLEYEMMTVEEFQERGGKWKNENREFNFTKDKPKKDIVKNKKVEYNKGEDVVAASSRYLNKNDGLYKNAKKIKPIEGYEDIVVHGDKYSLIFKRVEILD